MGCVPSLLFDLRLNYGGGDEDRATSFRRSRGGTAAVSAASPQQAPANPHLHRRLLDAHGHIWVSLLWDHCPFLLGPGVHKVLFVPSKSLLPQSCASSVIKTHWPPSQIPLGFSVPLPDPQVGKSVVRIIVLQFVGRLLSGSVVALVGTSSKRAYATCCDPGLLHPEPLPLRQATADLYLRRRHSNTQRQVWLSLCEVSGSWCAQDFV